MNAHQISTALFWSYRGSSDLLIPRFTPVEWFECDMWRLTKAGYSEEFEIKLSVSDFKADFAKVCEGSFRFDQDSKDWVRPEAFKKHESLAERHPRSPNRFWFVLAKDIVDKVEVPDYAGLIVADKWGSRVSVGVRKPAPKLHGAKFAGNRDRIRDVFYWRFWNLESKRTGNDSDIAAPEGVAL